MWYTQWFRTPIFVLLEDKSAYKKVFNIPFNIFPMKPVESKQGFKRQEGLYNPTMMHQRQNISNISTGTHTLFCNTLHPLYAE